MRVKGEQISGFSMSPFAVKAILVSPFKEEKHFYTL
jgi:hypothetical protein